MTYRFEDEIERLAAILEAEAAGRPVDPEEGRRLAERLARACPEIASTMQRVARRMDHGEIKLAG
jgi:hypothetical protein